MNFLPREKLCFYPPTVALRGPFEQSPWREMGREINNRRFTHEDFIAPGTWKINQSRDIICIQFSDYPRLIRNLRFTLTKEGLGLGPQSNCIVFDQNPSFYLHLAIVMTFLLRHKMFMYPSNLIRGGLFVQEPWLSRGHVIFSRLSLTFEEFQAHFPPEP